MNPDSVGWLVFAVVVPTMLALDLLVFNRRPHVLSLREAGAWVAVWVSLGLGFAGLVFLTRGSVSGTEYLTGYLLEYSLSMDNVFVFAMLFAYFGVPPENRHRLLYWGVLGAICFRAIFIVSGTLLLEAFHFLLYGLGVLLVYTGIKMATTRGEFGDPRRSRLVAALRRRLPVTDDYRGNAFLARENGRLVATPMLVALVVVEASDIMFAIDSVPAVFAITTDTFIVFTSNAFAILGLRSLYFLLAGLIDRFRYLRYGLGAILVFAGTKMLLSDVYDMPPLVSLSLIMALLAISIVASLLATRGEGFAPTKAADVHD